MVVNIFYPRELPRRRPFFMQSASTRMLTGAFTLLRSCAGWAKILYSCRTVPPTLQPDALAQADAHVRDALGRLLGSPLSADDWRLASLGISAGGIGARSAQEHAQGGSHRQPVRHGRPVHSYLAPPSTSTIWIPAACALTPSSNSSHGSQKAPPCRMSLSPPPRRLYPP